MTEIVCCICIPDSPVEGTCMGTRTRIYLRVFITCIIGYYILYKYYFTFVPSEVHT